MKGQLGQLLRRFWRDTQGTTSIEYALLASLIAVVIFVAVGATGNNLSNIYGNIAAKVASAL